jgi:hypothetical protein
MDDVRPALPPITSSVVPQKVIQDDRMFTDGPNQSMLDPQERLNLSLQERSSYAFQQDRVFNELRQRERFDTFAVRHFNDRLNEYRQRHFTLDGDVVVYCKVLNDWPRLVVTPLTVSLILSQEIPKLECGKKEELVKTVFRPLTLGVHRRLEPFIYEDRKTTQGTETFIDQEEYARLAFITCFKEWNIPVELEQVNGRLSDAACELLRKQVHPGLFTTIASEFLRLNEMSEEERAILDRQSAILFAKNSQGVTNPTEGIKLYCEASVFAKEFMLSGKDLDALPYRVATMVRFVTQKNNEMRASELDSGAKAKPTKSRKKR